MHAIFKSLPYQRVTGNSAETFDLYQCGLFNVNEAKENVELVRLEPNMEYKPHYHKHSMAKIYIILGNGWFRLNSEYVKYQPSKYIEVHAGVLHSFKTETETLFLSIQSPSIIHPETGAIDIHYPES